MRVEVEGGYGSSMVKLDIHKVLLLKEMKMKERRIEEVTQHQVCTRGLTKLLKNNYLFVSIGRTWKRCRSK